MWRSAESEIARLTRDSHRREGVDNVAFLSHGRDGESILNLVVGEAECARDLSHLLHDLEVDEMLLLNEGKGESAVDRTRHVEGNTNLEHAEETFFGERLG